MPSVFFGMHVTGNLVQDWPAVPFGALGKKNATSWRYLQESPGGYHWEPLDRYVEAAESHHVSAMYTFGQTPQWASSNPRAKCLGQGHLGCSAPPANIQHWINYVTAVVTRYKGRIRFYELWNEPGNVGEWSGSYEDMVTLAKHAYRIIKSIDPNAIVLTPAPGAGRYGRQPQRGPTNPIQERWMQEYLHAGGNSYADGGSFHAYPYYDTCSETLECAGSPLIAQVDRMRSVMDRNGMAGKPLYVTEGGWRKEEDLPEPDQQVAFIARWFIILASKGIAGAYWYAWDAKQLWGTLWDPETGIHPPGKAYAQVHNWLLGATISPCSVSKDNLWSCPLTRAKGYQALAIWNGSGKQSYSYTPGKEYKQYRDLVGNTVPIKGPVQVGIKPILLETSPPPQ